MMLRMGESATFEQVFRLHYAALCFYAEGMGVSGADAEDVVEEVFTSCWLSGQAFDNEDHARFYLYRAVKHSTLDHLKLRRRAEGKHQLAGEVFADREESHQERLIRSEVIARIYAQIYTLPTQEQRVMLLTLQERSLAEIAAEMELSLQTVKNCKTRALKHLRIKLSPDDLLLFLCLISKP